MRDPNLSVFLTGYYPVDAKLLRSLIGGAKGDRTPDLLHAMQALSHLSYGPVHLAGRARFELAEPLGSPAFETGAFGRSATCP